MNSRNSIRGIAITTGTAVAGVAVAAGLNVTGVLGDAASTDDFTNVAEADTVASAPAHMTLVQTRHRWQKHTQASGRRPREEGAQGAGGQGSGRRTRGARSREPFVDAHLRQGDPRAIARSMMASRYGWDAGQFSCLNSLWNRESGWNAARGQPVGCLRHPAGAARLEDGHDGRRLARQPGDPDRVGAVLREVDVRHPVQRLVRLPVQRLVLAPAPVRPSDHDHGSVIICP